MNNGISSQETLADVGAIRGVGGGYGTSGSFVGNGALFTVLDGKETREEVRKEGDQSALRDGFANTADNARFYAGQQTMHRMDDKSEARFITLDNKIDKFQDDFYKEQAASLRQQDIKQEIRVNALETQKEALQTAFKGCNPTVCSSCNNSSPDVSIMIQQMGQSIINAINASS